MFEHRNWRDVRWDHAAANEAIRALRAAADMLERTAGERRRVAREATAEWRGRYRNEFDVELDRMSHRATVLSAELRVKADEIARASQRAQEEQQRRERWRREQRAASEGGAGGGGAW